MPDLSYSFFDGKLHVYRRPESRLWQCATYLGGRNHRTSTRRDNLEIAIEFAKDWYLDRFADERLRQRGIPLPGQGAAVVAPPLAPAVEPKKAARPTFLKAAAEFLAEYEVATLGQRNPIYVRNKKLYVRKHLGPFFGQIPVADINAGTVQAYRVHRVASLSAPGGRIPSRSSMDQEVVTLRQILKMANRRGWIAALPDMSAPYKASGKISHRAWFSPEEYKRLFEATRERARNPIKERWRRECEHLHDYVLFMANTGLRPDEASRLEYRDVTVAVDEATSERILEIEVRGKRGVGHCKSMPGAVHPFLRLRKRADPQPTDVVFGPVQRELLNTILTELGLKHDRDGKVRTAYSLRHTYICMRLMEGADIYQVAKNCRTSVEMIEKFYAAHIKNTLDAAAINVRKVRKPRKAASAKKASANA